MQTCDTLLHAGVLLTQDDDRRVLENAALAIDGGRIVALGYSQDVTAAWQAREILDLSGMLVMPGLVNAHTHAAMTFLRGLADDMPLMDWLQQKIFPVEQGLTPDLVRLGSLLGFAEMLRTGTTSCVDMYIFEAAVLEAADKAGLRCLAGEGVFNFPSACCPDADAALACTREMAQRWAGHDRLHVAVMPHSVYTTTAAQLTACRELADELGLPLHIHLAETRQETALSLEQHGLRPVAHADRLGLLRPGTILAHVVDVDADEIALLARRGVSVVHNPSSNMKLASGVPAPRCLLVFAAPLYWSSRPGRLGERALRWRLAWKAWRQPVEICSPRSEAARETAPWQGHERVVCWRHMAEIAHEQPRLRALLPACDVPVCYVQLWHDSSCPRRNAVEWICTASRRAETHVLRTVSRHGGHLPLSHRESRDEVVRIACNFVRAVLES